MKGFELTEVRQPTDKDSGVIAFCHSAARGTLTITDAEIRAIKNGLTKLDDKLEQAIKELE